MRGLTVDDFEIDERRPAPATRATFALIDLPNRARTGFRARTASSLSPTCASVTRTFDGSLYVFLLDDLHTDVRRSTQVREAARRFVQQYLGANDLAAVVYTSGRQVSGQELTGNRCLLLAAIDRFQGRKLPVGRLWSGLRCTCAMSTTTTILADETQPGPDCRKVLQRARDIADPLRFRARGERSGAPWRLFRAGGLRGRPTFKDDGRRCCSSAKAWITTSTTRSMNSASSMLVR